MAAPLTGASAAIAVFGAAAVLVAAIGLWRAARANAAHRAAFQRFARAHGWSYAPKGPDPAKVYPGFGLFAARSGVRSRDILRSPDSDSVLFTFERMEQLATWMHSVAVLRMPRKAPPLAIEPHQAGLKAVDTLSARGIGFESAAFSQRFRVTCSDRRFAYGLVTPAMMEFLLGPGDGWTFEWRDDLLMVHRLGRLRPEALRPLLDLAQGFAHRVPRHLLAAPAAGGDPALGRAP